MGGPPCQGVSGHNRHGARTNILEDSRYGTHPYLGYFTAVWSSPCWSTADPGISARCNVAKLHAGLPVTSMSRYVNHTALCEGQQPGQTSSSRKLCLTVSSIVIKIISSECASFFISHSSATAMVHSESVLGLHYQSLPDSQGLASSSHACHCNSGSGPPT